MVQDRGRELAPLLHALADPTRLGIVQLLSTGPRRAGKLAKESGLSATAASKHLRVLLQAGVIADERPPEDARVRIFRLRPESVAAIRAWLDQLQAHWDDQLRAFKRHVERQR